MKSTIIALIAVTSLLLPFTSEVNWLSRALWIASMVSAFLSVAFSCKHQRFIGNLLLAKSLWEFKKFLHDSLKTDPAKPKLGVVLLLSGTKTFFDLSLMLYVIGLGVYLGCVSQGRADKDTGEASADNLNVFIWFLVFAFLCYITYWAMDHLTNTGHLQGWTCHLRWFLLEADFWPCVDDWTCDRNICSTDDPGKCDYSEDFPCKQPLLLRMILSGVL